MPISASEQQHWKDHGFLILPGFFNSAVVDKINNCLDALWSERALLQLPVEIDILSGPDAHQSFLFKEAKDQMRDQIYKLNNLFIFVEEVRKIALDAKLKTILSDLLDGEPVICNSLNFERGSCQPFHFDTWYMPPPVKDKMVVTSIALEDIDDTNGPLQYYPGSHLIPPYLFSHGRLNVINEELPNCLSYVDEEIAQRNLHSKTFSCKKGDVFVWHSQLYHGGSAIKNMKRTRKTLVTHYWRKQDLPAEGLVEFDEGFCLKKTLRGELSV